MHNIERATFLTEDYYRSVSYYEAPGGAKMLTTIFPDGTKSSLICCKMFNEKPIAMKGGRPEDIFFNAAMNNCIAGIANNPDLVIHYDIESGFPSLITKKQQQDIVDMWEAWRPKDGSAPVGKIHFFGTGGGM
jgi:hypothetical protein